MTEFHPKLGSKENYVSENYDELIFVNPSQEFIPLITQENPQGIEDAAKFEQNIDTEKVLLKTLEWEDLEVSKKKFYN